MFGRVRRTGRERTREAAAALKRLLTIAPLFALGFYLVDMGLGGDWRMTLNVSAGATVIALGVRELIR